MTAKTPARLSATRRAHLHALAGCGLSLAGLARPPELAAQARVAPSQGLGDIASVVAAAKPAVYAVGVYSRIGNPPFRFAGTGFAIEGGLFITCAHVVQTLDPTSREVMAVAVHAVDGIRVIEVKVAASRRETDLAILEPVSPPPFPLRGLKLATGLPAEGSEILLIGFPIGSALGLHAATHRGIVAAVVPMAMPLPTTTGLDARNVQALRQEPIEILQMDATAYPGNSGGPVLDVRTGLVVGVVSLALVKGTRESAISSPTGISYAVPVQHLARMVTTR